MAVGHFPETPGIAGRTLMHSDPGANPPGQPFDTGGPQARARFHRDSGSTQRDIGHGPESPGTAVVRGTSDQEPSRPGELVETTAFRRGPKSPGTADRPSGPSDQSTSGRGELVDPVSPWPWARVSQESWWTPWALGPGPDSPKPSDRPHRHSDNSVSLPGLLVHPTGNRTQARGARDSWSTPRAFRHGPESPGTTGGPC